VSDGAEQLVQLSGAQRPRRWLTPLRMLSLILLAAVIVFVGRQLVRDIRELRAQRIEISINWIFVALAVLCLMGARMMNSLNTWLLLKALGADLPPHKVVGAIWVSSLGRYIPGKVAVVAGSLTLLTRMGARLPVVGAALLRSTGIMILISMVATTPLFFLPEVRQGLPSAPVFSALVLGMALVCLHPPIFLWLCNIALRAIKREPVPLRVRAGAFWAAVGLALVRIGFVGSALWMAARAVAPIGPDTLLHVLGSAALATVTGFLAVFAPAGVGVHEAIYLLTLKSLLGAKVAVLVIMFRILQLSVDLIAAAVGGTIMRGEQRTAIPQSEDRQAENAAAAPIQPLEPGGA
jgi:glycosyltransferase 2 family protein